MKLKIEFVKCINDHYNNNNGLKKISYDEVKIINESKLMHNVYVNDYKVKRSKANDALSVMVVLSKIGKV